MADSEFFQRFQKSRNIAYEQWHDGIGYDLDAFASMSPEEKRACSRSSDPEAAGLAGYGSPRFR
jgi:hypothetical protein